MMSRTTSRPILAGVARILAGVARILGILTVVSCLGILSKQLLSRLPTPGPAIGIIVGLLLTALPPRSVPKSDGRVFAGLYIASALHIIVACALSFRDVRVVPFLLLALALSLGLLLREYHERLASHGTSHGEKAVLVGMMATYLLSFIFMPSESRRSRSMATAMRMLAIADVLASEHDRHEGYPRYSGDVRGMSALTSVLPLEKLCDAWGNPIQYESDGMSYGLLSYGRDGRLSSHFSDDIVIRNGVIIRTDPEIRHLMR